MNRLSYIYNKVSSGQFLYAYAVVALLLPNIALCYTECLTPWACGVNVLLPFRCVPAGIALSFRNGSDSGRYVFESRNYQSR